MVQGDIKIFAAPLQGFTEAAWRNIHCEVFGGIDSYVTPFLRYEHDCIRNKDIRDIEKKNNTVPHLIPQIIAATPEELAPLMELIIGEGYTEADINMGCSFALQVRKYHGAGLLPHPDKVAAIMNATHKYPNVKFSVKMRLGLEDKQEWRDILPILNDTELTHITLHPRLGSEQYRNAADTQEFAHFYEECRHPLVYNGDLTTIKQIEDILHLFPNLHGIMIGRGLLADPTLGISYKQQRIFTNSEKAALISKFHNQLYETISPRLQGNTQKLNKLKPYWEYLLPDMDKRSKKAIKKSTTAEKYLAAVNNALSNY